MLRIDIPNNFDKINVEAAVEDEQSILQTYRHLIQLRHEVQYFHK
jgi:trehalose-6-phosphate hydrolase